MCLLSGSLNDRIGKHFLLYNNAASRTEICRPTYKILGGCPHFVLVSFGSEPKGLYHVAFPAERCPCYTMIFEDFATASTS